MTAVIFDVDSILADDRRDQLLWVGMWSARSSGPMLMRGS